MFKGSQEGSETDMYKEEPYILYSSSRSYHCRIKKDDIGGT
jgi:hypothetical protein